MGSTFAARRAGIKLASRTTATMMAGTRAKVKGSVAFIWYNMDDIICVSTRDQARPMARPIVTKRMPFPRTKRITCWGRAPSAIRMPISWVRRLTA